MKIIINTETKKPVEIGELLFEVDFSDEALERYQLEGKKIIEKLSAISSNDYKELKFALEEVIDFFLEPGSFKKIYTKYPSVLTCGDIATQLMVNVGEELSERGKSLGNSEKVKNYLKKNNK